MKYLLVFCFSFACLVTLANCDCTTTCVDTFTSATKSITSPDAAQFCPLVQTYKECLQISCKVDLSPYMKVVQDILKSHAIPCDLGSDSKAVCSSRLTVLGAVLLASYKTIL